MHVLVYLGVHCLLVYYTFFFFYNDPATTEIYTLSLHDALPISLNVRLSKIHGVLSLLRLEETCSLPERSEEHTSELQSHHDLVCRLLLEKKKLTNSTTIKQTFRRPIHSLTLPRTSVLFPFLSVP